MFLRAVHEKLGSLPCPWGVPCSGSPPLQAAGDGGCGCPIPAAPSAPAAHPLSRLRHRAPDRGAGSSGASLVLSHGAAREETSRDVGGETLAQVA